MTYIKCPERKPNKCPKGLKFLANKRFAERGGIIPYYIDAQNIKYYLLGAKKLKKGYRWSDFGGGCKRKETVLQCAIREFLEESRGIVNISIDNITHVHIINSSKPYRVMLFVKLNEMDGTIPERFENIIPSSKAEEEIVKVKWFSEYQLLSLPKKNTSKSIKEVISSGLTDI